MGIDMVKKQIKNNSNLIKVVIISVIGIIIVIIFPTIKPQINPSNENVTLSLPSELKKYHSNILDITINIPNDFSAKEIYGNREILLEKDSDVIKIHRIGTNKKYKNTDEFLDDIFGSDSTPKNIEKKYITIDGFDVVKVDVKYTTSPNLDDRTYYFFINNGFYTISTTSQALYSDLDQIAQSFRYE